MLFYFFNARNAARTCRHFGISRQTFYRWKRRFDRHELSTLEGHSHRPRRVRQPTWAPRVAARGLAPPKQKPPPGKGKFGGRFRKEKSAASTSTGGRIRFPIAAFQVDGGSEFAAEFEEACRQKQIPLFVLPPRSPKLNGHVERSNRTHNEEFYELAHGQPSLAALNHQLRNWENTYNCVRPHQALGYLTPQEFLLQWKRKSKRAKCH